MSLLAERLTAQLLAGRPAPDPQSVVEHLLAVQAQDIRGALLAVRARSRDATLAAIEREFTEHRSLLVSWLNRGTLHLVHREDYPWLQALTTPQLQTGTMRRLAQSSVSPDAAERGVAAIARALGDEGPLGRDALRERLTAARIPTQGQAFVHLLVLASIRGLIIRGPLAGGEQSFVLLRDWLGVSRPVDRKRALAELARRYLTSHGPASDRDLARWAGLPLRDVRTGLAAIAPDLHEYEDGLLHLASRRPAASLPDPRLLGAFDPVLLGWQSRELILGGSERQVVSGGIFRAFALVSGRAAATWTVVRGRVELRPFGRIAPSDRVRLDRDALEVERFLGR